MKKKLLVIVMLSIFASVNVFGQDTIIGWTFPTGKKSDSIANYGILANKNKAISLKSDSMIMFITGTYATPPSSAQAMGLSNGTALEKGWYIGFYKKGYKNLKLYSKQNACMMHSGPKYFKIQYMCSCTPSWTDITGGSVTVGLNWKTGVINGLALPADIDDDSIVYIRWVMASDSNVAGSSMGTPITSNGSMSRIDDIFITGTFVPVNVPMITYEMFKIYPNPAKDYFRISSKKTILKIQLIEISGKIMKSETINSSSFIFNCSDIKPGIYFIDVNFKDDYHLKQKVEIQ